MSSSALKAAVPKCKNFNLQNDQHCAWFTNQSNNKTVVSPASVQLKVGLIKQCDRHPDADKLYVSQILSDGTDKPITVCSGLVDFIPQDQLQGSRVVLVMNLKPVNMRGVKSQAMLLAAEKLDSEGQLQTVELVEPPLSSQVGQTLSFKGFEVDLDAEPQRLNTKNWTKIQARLFTNANGHVVYKDQDDVEHVLTSQDGNDQCEPCSVKSAFNSQVR